MAKDAHGYEFLKEGLNKHGTRSAFILLGPDGDVIHWGPKKECEAVRSSLLRLHQMKGEGPHVRSNPVSLREMSDRELAASLEGKRGKARDEILKELGRRAAEEFRSNLMEAGRVGHDTDPWKSVRRNPSAAPSRFSYHEGVDGMFHLTVFDVRDAKHIRGKGPYPSARMASLEAQSLNRLLAKSKKASNPSRNHPPELPVGAEPVAYELANAVRSLLPEKDQLVEHLKKTSRRSDFDREKYAEFLAKTWVMPAAKRYYRNDADAKRYATLPVRRLAGEIYVDHVLDGEWA